MPFINGASETQISLKPYIPGVELGRAMRLPLCECMPVYSLLKTKLHLLTYIDVGRLVFIKKMKIMNRQNYFLLFVNFIFGNFSKGSESTGKNH